MEPFHLGSLFDHELSGSTKQKTAKGGTPASLGLFLAVFFPLCDTWDIEELMGRVREGD